MVNLGSAATLNGKMRHQSFGGYAAKRHWAGAAAGPGGMEG